MKINKMLTKRQKEIVDFIRTYTEDRGYAPSYREIAEELGLSSTATIHEHIKGLEKKGYLRVGEKGEARALEPCLPAGKPLGALWKLGKVITLPLAGLITAGEPIEALEERETMAVPADLVRDENAFVLKVKGESMIEDGILSGDFVIVERNFYPKNGDVVVALLDNQYATLKRYYREKNRIRLQPANSAMKPIYALNPAIQGIVRAVIRKFATL